MSDASITRETRAVVFSQADPRKQRCEPTSPRLSLAKLGGGQRTALLGCLLATAVCGVSQPAFSQSASFTKDVAPILASHCGGCHVRARKGDFRVQDYRQLIDSEHVVAGSPDSSTLISMVESGEMPPRSSVPKADLEALKNWIRGGAKFDGKDKSASLLALAKAAPARKSPSAESEPSGGGGGYGESYGESYGDEEYGEEGEYGEGYGDEDEYGEGYGEDSYGGGYGSSANQGVLSQLPSSVSGLSRAAMLAGAATEDNISTGPVLAADAKEAFAAGNLPLALNLHLAHMVAEFKQAGEALAAVQYSAPLRRPVWQMKWGVSLMVRGDESIEDYAPIGSESTGNRLASRGGGGYGGEGYGEDYGDDYGEEDFEEEYGDDYGSEYGESYGEDYGQEGGRPAPAPTTQPAEQPVAPTQYSTLGQETRERFEKVLGMVGEQVADGFSKRYRAGRFGAALNEVEPTENATVSGDWFEPADMPMWIPGVVFVGEGSHKEMAKTAADNGIEMLLHFDVALAQNREDVVKNTSVCRILHAPSGKTVVLSKPMENLEAQKQAKFERATESEFVQTQLSNLFSVLDQKVAVSPMPRLKPEQARQRVAQILSSNNKLRALAEIRLFQAQDLLTAEEVEVAFQIIAGDDGLVMLHGPEEQRIQVGREWAKQQN